MVSVIHISLVSDCQSSSNGTLLLGVYPGVKACQVFRCSVAIVREEEEEDTCVRYLCVMLGSSS